MPDLSKIVGEPKAPPHTTTNFNTLAVKISVVPFGQEMASSKYSIPTATPFLSKIKPNIDKEDCYILKDDTLHTLFNEYVQVRVVGMRV